MGTSTPLSMGLRSTLVAHLVLALLRHARKRPKNMPRASWAPHLVARPHTGSQDCASQVISSGEMHRHVRAYHGKSTLRKAYLSRRRLAAPATTDCWVNDRRGDPWFVVMAEANVALPRMPPSLLDEMGRSVSQVADLGL